MHVPPLQGHSVQKRTYFIVRGALPFPPDPTATTDFPIVVQYQWTSFFLKKEQKKRKARAMEETSRQTVMTALYATMWRKAGRRRHTWKNRQVGDIDVTVIVA